LNADRETRLLVTEIVNELQEKGIAPNFSDFIDEASLRGLEVNLDMLRIFDQRVNRSRSSITEKNVVYFVSNFVSKLNPKRILDPACGSGSFFAEIDPKIKLNSEFIGIDKNYDMLEVAKKFFKHNIDKNDVNYDFIYGDFFDLFFELGNFDLIICDPPQGKTSNFTDVRLEQKNIADAFLFKSLNILSNKGYLFFIVYDSFFYRRTPVKRYMLENFAIEAVISLPKGNINRGFNRSLICVKRDKKPQNLFLAKLNDQKSADAIIDNFFNNKSTNNKSEGYWINSNKINEENVWSIDYFTGLDTLKNKKGKIYHSFKHLGEIATVKPRFQETDDILLIPRTFHKNSREVIFIPELEIDEKHGNNKEIALNPYYQCKVSDKNIVLPQYLKIFLNSELGKYQRRLFSSGSTVGMINIRGIKSMSIAIPEISIQKKIISADQKITEWYNETLSLHERFKNKIFNFDEVLGIISDFQEDKELSVKDKKPNNLPEDTIKPHDEEIKALQMRNPLYDDLLWPLASSYINATKGISEPVGKALNYFNLFELVSAFNSIFLLSSLPKDFYLENKERIWGNYNDYRSVSFGNWVGLYRRLSEIFREGKLDLPFDKELYDKISSPKIINIMDIIPAKRNRCVHGSDFNSAIAENVISELNPYLNEIFKILMSYNTLKLIYTESMTKESEIYKIKVKRLNGACYPFIHETITTERDMESNALYLYNSITDERLKLKKEFIKLTQCPECGLWSLYIYNKVKNNKAVYRSYQTEQHDLKIPNVTLEGLFELD